MDGLPSVSEHVRRPAGWPPGPMSSAERAPIKYFSANITACPLSAPYMWNASFPCRPLDVTTPYFLQDASSSSPAQPGVIVVPLYLVSTDRGHESSARPPASLGPLGPPIPATSPAGSPLTFPTLDDFIPPHLQRRPQHHLRAGTPGPVPPVSPPPPSFSPPPPLVPAAPECFHRAWEPDRTGAVSSTVSLLQSPYPVPPILPP